MKKALADLLKKGFVGLYSEGEYTVHDLLRILSRRFSNEKENIYTDFLESTITSLVNLVHS